MAQRMCCRETRRCYTAAITFAPSNQRPRVGGVTMQQVTVRVPASTSNLGPGYDCLGVALQLYNNVTLVRDKTPRSSYPRIVSDAEERFFKQTRGRAFPFSYSIVERIPRCRGLGSSATVRLGILLALNQLSGKPLHRLTLFRLCAELEGHPDNAAPASFGGFTVVGSARRAARTPQRGGPTIKSAIRFRRKFVRVRRLRLGNGPMNATGRVSPNLSELGCGFFDDWRNFGDLLRRQVELGAKSFLHSSADQFRTVKRKEVLAGIKSPQECAADSPSDKHKDESCNEFPLQDAVHFRNAS